MKIKSFFQGRNFFEIPADVQQEYLKSLGTANNDIERSYNQYRCQKFFMPIWLKLLNDVISALLFPLLLCFYFAKSFFSKPSNHLECIGEFSGMTEIIPNSLRQKYQIDIDSWFQGEKLDLSDVCYVFKYLIKHPLSPLFVLKTMIKIAKYSNMIYAHSPSAIAVHNEYSFTSSLLTDYCHKHGVRHINVMHGEKLAIIRDSFFHYDECYVWDEYYKHLFISQKAEASRFIIELPESMKIDIRKYHNKYDYSDYKYYLAATTEDKMIAIAKSMNFALKEGKSVKYRLHPRFSDASLVEKIVGKENVEYPNSTSILSSIANCGCAVGSYTTVLNQAYHAGISVLIDDVAEKEMYEKLSSFRYILINKGLPKLSEKQYVTPRKSEHVLSQEKIVF